MNKLRLGPVVEEKPVKLTVELPGTVYRDVSDYAKAHATENGLSQPLAPEKLIGPMLARFMASDRGFTRMRRRE